MAENMCVSSTSLDYSNLKTSLNYSTLSLMSVLSNASHSNNNTRAPDLDTTDFVFCLTCKSLMNNKELMAAIQHFSPEYSMVENPEKVVQMAADRRKYFFVFNEFDGDLFQTLRKKCCHICAPPFLIYLYKRNRSIPSTTRPLFNGSMFGAALCFTGFASKRDSVSQLADLVHYMGGSVRKDFSGKITHVIANLAQGQKYKAAVNLGRHIMTEEWILQSWRQRYDVSFKATNADNMKDFFMKPFHGLKLSFFGFSDDETKHMNEITTQNGGEVVTVIGAECTHLVIDEMTSSPLPSPVNTVGHVVKQEWFWASIQLEACAEESMYYFVTDEGTPLGIGSQRIKKKRKLLNASDISDLLSPNSPYGGANKRRSRDGRLSTVSSATFESSLGASPYFQSHMESPQLQEQKTFSARFQRCLELQQTERNYVDILKTIIKIFKEPLEESANQRGGLLLPAEDIKTIFGSIPDLLETHERLLSSVDNLINGWHEGVLIGKAVNDCADNMIKVYPGFVNYFEMIKDTVIRCDKERPRFHAFLKICLTKPDCRRQSLQELLIRPVQRIPSLSLLLNDILKKTPATNPDFVQLSTAVESIKKVLTHINEDKRKTEHQVEMFEIMHEVDNCPPYILSSHRCLVQKVDVVEAAEGLILKTDQMIMYLFNDSIELAKRRNKILNNATNNYKSPALNNIQKASQPKVYKHVEFIQLSHMKSVVDIKDDEDHKDMFGLLYHSKAEQKDNLSIFKLACNTISKPELIEKIIKCICETQSSSHDESYMMSVEASELTHPDKNDTSDMKEKSGYLIKALKKAKGGFSKKVGRAFSLNKTPKQNAVKANNPHLKKTLSITPINDSFKNLSSVSPCLSEYTAMDYTISNEK